MAANLAALRTLRTIQHDQRPATGSEQAVLARWSGWGAVPAVFDPDNDAYAAARASLAGLLSPDEFAAAARSTLNAHYTDADLVRAVWAGLAELGFTAGAVLEPGCGSGNFIGFAPPHARIVGIELDPTTATIAISLYPAADIRTESFADTRAPHGSFDAAVGNVPFGKLALSPHPPMLTDRPRPNEQRGDAEPGARPTRQPGTRT